MSWWSPVSDYLSGVVHGVDDVMHTAADGISNFFGFGDVNKNDKWNQYLVDSGQKSDVSNVPNVPKVKTSIKEQAPFEQLNPMSWLTNIGGTIADYLFKSDLQYKQWAREDSAVQRRVADLKAAGLNPLLAVSGAGAASTTPMLSSFSPFQSAVERNQNRIANYQMSMALQSNQLAIQRQLLENILLSKDVDNYTLNTFFKNFGIGVKSVTDVGRLLKKGKIFDIHY